MSRDIVAVVGMCGSGKSVAVEEFVARGWTKIYFGGVVIDRLTQLNLPKNEANERMVREALRKEYGAAAFAKLLLPKIAEADREGRVVLDGLYSWSEYLCLKQALGDRIRLLAVVTDRALRYARLAGRELRPLSAEDATKRDFAEIENSEKGGPISFADHFITNNGTEAEFRAAVRSYLDLL